MTKPATEEQSNSHLRRDLHKIAATALLVPPAVGGTLMAVLGFYPMPEWYLSLLSYTGVYFAIVAAGVLVFGVPRAHRFLVKLSTMPPSAARSAMKAALPRVVWIIPVGVTLYTIGGAVTVDVSMEHMGYANYGMAEHLAHQLGLIPVVLLTAFPVFFMTVDRIGRFFSSAGLTACAIPVSVKLYVLGLVGPILVATVFLAHYYTATGYLSGEAIVLWASLIAVAAVATHLAWRSFARGLAPLEEFLDVAAGPSAGTESGEAEAQLRPQSLDELGELTSRLSELLRQRRELNHESQRLRNVLDASVDAFAVADMDGKLTYVNEAFVKLWRLPSAESALGRSNLEYWEDPNAAYAVVKEVMQAGSWTGELVGVRADGTKADIRVSSVLLRDESGVPYATAGSFVDVTEEKTAARELKAERDFGESLLQTVPAIVLLLDHDGRIRYCNAQCERVTGYTLDEIRGENWFTRFLPERERERVRNLFENVSVGGETHGNINPILTRDGTEREVEWYDRPLQNDRGGVERVLAVGLDVTESRHLEREVSENERRLKEAQRMAKIGSWELDLVENTLLWSDEIYRIFERDPERFEPSYERFLESVHPEDRDTVKRAYRESVESGDSYEIAHRLLMPDGAVKHVRETGESEFDEVGRPIKSVGTVQDITELYRARHELERYRDRLEQLVAERTAELRREHDRNTYIVNAAMDGFFIADSSGKVVECNEAYCSMLGYTRAELLTLSVAHIEAVENEEDVAAHIAHVVEQGRDRFDTRHKRKDGTEIDVELQVVSRTTEDGSYEFYAYVHDIAQRVLQARELAASRDEAERANQAKSDFLSRMSHELRTPLNAILGFGELLESDTANPLSETQADDVAEIIKAGRRLLEMVNEVLDLSRAERGRLDVSVENVRLSDLLAEVVAEMEPSAERRGIHITKEFDEIPDARGDRRRIKQILESLLSNAVKYNHDEGSVVVRSEPAAENRVEIAVTDTGPGMEQELLDRIFGPFERHESAGDGGEGAGIGLALSRSLAVAMGGEITVESTPGAGSTFRLSLPAVSASPAESATASAGTVMYVDDNRINLMVVERMLGERSNINVVTASSAEEFLETVPEARPDIVLLDINLPGADGFDALRRLREDPTTEGIPVVAVTASVFPEDIERYNAAGFAEVVEKPITRERLFAVVDGHYSGHNADME